MADNYQITVTLSGRDDLSDELSKINTTLGKIEESTRKTSQATTNMDNSFRNLKNSISSANNFLNQFGLGISALGIVQAVTDLNDLGREVNSVSTTFEQLSGGPEAAARSLANMREMTGGVVDDLTLMQGANSLLLTGLADTNDQAAELVDLGFRLSAAMGVDAKEGIENLNAALLNNSFARLDTLGISAAAVRERVAELKEEGYDMSEAFAQAVLEEGREKIELLGDAALTAETSFNRLMASMRNNRQELGQFIAAGFEAGAQLVELAGIAGEIGIGDLMTLASGGSMADINQRDFAQGLVNDTRMARVEQGVNPFGVFADTSTENLVDFAMNDSRFGSVSSGSAFTDRAAGRSVPFGMTAEDVDAIFNQVTGYNFTDLNFQDQAEYAAELDAQLSIIAGSLAEVAEAEARAAREQEALNVQTMMFEEAAQGYIDVQRQQALAAEAAARASSEEQQTLNELRGAYTDLVMDVAGSMESINGISIMDPAAAAEIVGQANALQYEFEQLQQIAEETDFQYITEDELSNAESLANQAAEFADDAERAAAAFEAMSLTDLFGQTNGGRMGELSDMVLANVEDEDARAALQSQFDMASGRETEVSQAFEQEIAPLLAQISEQLGGDVGIEATNRALAALEEGTLAGLSGQELVDSIASAIGIAMTSSGQFVQTMGMDGAAALEEVNGMPFNPFGEPAAGAEGEGEGESGNPQIDGMNAGLATMQEQILVVEEGIAVIAGTDLEGVLDPFVHSFGVVQDATAVIRSELDAMAGTTYRTSLIVDVNVNDPNGFLAGNSAAFSGAMGTATTNNGGSAPGTAGPF